MCNRAARFRAHALQDMGRLGVSDPGWAIETDDGEPRGGRFSGACKILAAPHRCEEVGFYQRPKIRRQQELPEITLPECRRVGVDVPVELSNELVAYPFGIQLEQVSKSRCQDHRRQGGPCCLRAERP